MGNNKNAFEAGMIAGAKPFEEKFNKVADSVERIGKQLSADINEIGDIQKALIDIMEEKDKKELFDLNSIPDVKKVLDKTEQEYLVASVLTIANTLDVINDYQKVYMRNLLNYLEIRKPQMNVQLAYIENVDRLTSQKAIMQTVMEMLYLGTASHQYYDEFEPYFELFSVTERQKNEIMENIETMSHVIGLQGIAERYTDKKAESIDLSDYVKLSGDDVDEYSLGAEIKKRVRIQRYTNQIIHITEEYVTRLFSDDTNIWEFVNCEIHYGGEIGIETEEGDLFYRFENCEFYFDEGNTRKSQEKSPLFIIPYTGGFFGGGNKINVTVCFYDCLFEQCGPLFRMSAVWGAADLILNKCVVKEPLSHFFEGAPYEDVKSVIKKTNIYTGEDYFKKECEAKEGDFIFENVTFEDCVIQCIGSKEYKIYNAVRSKL